MIYGYNVVCVHACMGGEEEEGVIGGVWEKK